MIEASDKKAVFLGNAPSVTPKAGDIPARLYTNLPDQNIGNIKGYWSETIRDIPLPSGSSFKTIVAVKNSVSGLWALFGTTGAVAPFVTNRHGQAFKASADWRYLGSQTEDGLRPEDSVAQEIGAELVRSGLNQVQGADNLIMAVGPKTERELMRLMNQLDAAGATKYDEAAETLFQRDTTGRFEVLPGRNRFKFSARMLDRMYPPDSPVQSMLANNWNAAVLRHGADRITVGDVVGSQGLHFSVDAAGRIEIPYSTATNAAGSEAGQNAQFVAALMTGVMGRIDGDVMRALADAAEDRVRTSSKRPALTIDDFAARAGLTGTTLIDLLRYPLETIPLRNADGAASELKIKLSADLATARSIPRRIDAQAPQMSDNEASEFIDIPAALALTRLTAAYHPTEYVRSSEEAKASTVTEYAISPHGLSRDVLDPHSSWKLVRFKVKRDASTPAKIIGYLIPPMADRDKQYELIKEVVSTHSNNEWTLVPAANGSWASNFNFKEWSLMVKQLPVGETPDSMAVPRTLYIKGAFAGDGADILDANGEKALFQSGALENEETWNMLYDYSQGGLRLDPETKKKLRKFMPLNKDDRAEQAKINRFRSLLTVRSRNEDVEFRKSENLLGAVQDAIGAAAGISDLGSDLVDTFPQGFLLKSGMSGDHRHYRFDRAGTLYVVNALDPDNANYWRPVPQRIFSHDSEYLRVLKGLSALAKADGRPSANVPETGDEIVAASFASDRPLPFHQRRAFSDWVEKLNSAIGQAVEGRSADQQHMLNAITAFPTLNFLPGNVLTEDTQEETQSALVSCAVNGNDARAHAIINKLAMGKDVPYRQALALRDMSITGYQTFASWVRATYEAAAFPERRDPTYELKNHERVAAQQAQEALKDELLEHISRVKATEDGIGLILRNRAPDSVKNEELRRERWSDDSFFGMAGNYVFDRLIDPLRRWIEDTWHFMWAVYDRALHVATNPTFYVRKMVPQLWEAIEEALHLFFRRAAKITIDTTFEDGEYEGKHVSYGRVRGALTEFLDQSIHLRAMSGQEVTKMGRLAGGSYHAETMANQYGNLFKTQYRPEFRGPLAVQNLLAGDLNAVGFYIPETDKQKASSAIIVDIPFLRPEALDFTSDLAYEVASRGSEGLVIRPGKDESASAASGAFMDWWLRKGQDAPLVHKFAARVRDARFPDSKEVLHPTAVKLVSRNGIIHMQAKYRMQDAFPFNYNEIRQAVGFPKLQSYRRQMLGADMLAMPSVRTENDT